jgi:hypothetical protein
MVVMISKLQERHGKEHKRKVMCSLMEEELFEPPRAPDQKGGQTLVTEAIESCDGGNGSIRKEKRTQLRRPFRQMHYGEQRSRICERGDFHGLLRVLLIARTASELDRIEAESIPRPTQKR